MLFELVWQWISSVVFGLNQAADHWASAVIEGKLQFLKCLINAFSLEIIDSKRRHMLVLNLVENLEGEGQHLLLSLG